MGEPVAQAVAAPGERRTPRQERSKAKVDHILDAAEQLVITNGTSDLTTTRVAEFAGVAVGTLYQYFDGIVDLLLRLESRCAERFAGLVESRLHTQRPTRKRDVANLALDCCIEFYRHDALAQALTRDTGRFSDVFGAAAPVVAKAVTQSLARNGLGGADDGRFTVEVELHMAIAQALLPIAFRLNRRGDPAVIAYLRHGFSYDTPPTTR